MPWVHVEKNVEMEAYDSLSPRLRRTLGYAPGPFSASECADLLEDGVGEGEVVRRIRGLAKQIYGRSDDGFCGRHIARTRR